MDLPKFSVHPGPEYQSMYQSRQAGIALTQHFTNQIFDLLQDVPTRPATPAIIIQPLTNRFYSYFDVHRTPVQVSGISIIR